MRFVSTRGKAPPLDFEETLLTGPASDGGLYVPESFPRFELGDFPEDGTLAEFGARLLAPFVKDSALESRLAEICRAALDFPIPLVRINDSTLLLELHHGPTAAFKDVGARFLAGCLSAGNPKKATERPKTVLVATSGDTGGAVAAAFHGKPGVRVVILFPKDKVSGFQELQLTCWGDNVHALRVRGNFDDCQRMVKEAFREHAGSPGALISANSINIGRILPQSVYHARASLEHFRRSGTKPGLIIPSGNLGNAVAALWARRMGFPIGPIILACNANRAVPDFFDTGRWEPRSTVTTLANAMDVGDASNMERLRHLHPDLRELKQDTRAIRVGDEEIRRTIARSFHREGLTLCPHTAVAASARESAPAGDWVIVATAHAAKFREIVEPLIGAPVQFPPALQALTLAGLALPCPEIDAGAKNFLPP